MWENKFDEAKLDIQVERDLRVTVAPVKPLVGPGEDGRARGHDRRPARPAGLGRALDRDGRSVALAALQRPLPPIGPFFYNQTRTGAFSTEATNTFRYAPATMRRGAGRRRGGRADRGRDGQRGRSRRCAERARPAGARVTAALQSDQDAPASCRLLHVPPQPSPREASRREGLRHDDGRNGRRRHGRKQWAGRARSDSLLGDQKTVQADTGSDRMTSEARETSRRQTSRKKLARTLQRDSSSQSHLGMRSPLARQARVRTSPPASGLPRRPTGTPAS